jgi:hypothetical protein
MSPALARGVSSAERRSLGPSLLSRFHPGRWMGAENAKHHGTRSGGVHTGLSRFYDCCDAEHVDDPGCATGFHTPYD